MTRTSAASAATARHTTMSHVFILGRTNRGQVGALGRIGETDCTRRPARSKRKLPRCHPGWVRCLGSLTSVSCGRRAMDS